MEKKYYIKPGLYQPYKGMYYNVIGVVRNSETLDYKVLYQALYGDCGLWDRPFDMFVENVNKDGKTFPRFKFIADQVPEELVFKISEVRDGISDKNLYRISGFVQ